MRAFPTFHLYIGMQRVAELAGADVARLSSLIAQHAPAATAPAPAPVAATAATGAGASGAGPGVGAAAGEGPGAANPATAAEMQGAIMAALGDLRAAVPGMDDFVTSVRTLLTFVGNVVAHPAEAKYRRIRMNNANFQLRLGRHRGRGREPPPSCFSREPQPARLLVVHGCTRTRSPRPPLWPTTTLIPDPTLLPYTFAASSSLAYHNFGTRPDTELRASRGAVGGP